MDKYDIIFLTTITIVMFTVLACVIFYSYGYDSRYCEKTYPASELISINTGEKRRHIQYVGGMPIFLESDVFVSKCRLNGIDYDVK